MNLDLHNLKFTIYSTIITFISAVASFGLLLFVYERDLFLKLDQFKFLVLSLSTVLPLIFFNGFFGHFTWIMTKGNDVKLNSHGETFRLLLEWGSIFSVIELSFLSLLGYLYQLETKTAVKILFYVNFPVLFIFCGLYVLGHFVKKSIKKKEVV